jgi:hypothetical protein
MNNASKQGGAILDAADKLPEEASSRQRVSPKRRGFAVRAVYECGWNLFLRKGFSEDSRDIAVNYRYLDHLQAAGINRLVVFWTNAPAFDEAWSAASAYAHRAGIEVARGVYAYSGGGPSYLMAEPDAPTHLLRASRKGPETALCPFDEETREWSARMILQRLEPDIDSIVIEPARMISRQCLCPRCTALLPYEWDVMVVNDLADHLYRVKPDIDIWPYVYMPGDRSDMLRMAEAYRGLGAELRRIFAWGPDGGQAMTDWLRSDSRFHPYVKLGRAILFPDGRGFGQSAEERVEEVFRRCRMAAELGKECFMFDYRVFGGREWIGHEHDEPVTRQGANVPASLAVIGAAMNRPYMEAYEQRQLLAGLRANSDWDLDDPRYFYQGNLFGCTSIDSTGKTTASSEDERI